MRIALIEDTYSCAVEIQEQLKRFSQETGAEIICEYFSGGAAFLTHPVSDWDLILLDIEMPEMNEMCIRDRSSRHLPVSQPVLQLLLLHGYMRIRHLR